MSIISKILAGGAGDLIKSIGGAGGIIDTLTTSKEEKAKITLDITNAINSHVEKMAASGQAELDSYLKDMDSARNMQIEALKQGDTFSKRFIYYLAIVVIVMVFVFDMMMFFVKYPAENRDMINMIAGILNSTALVMVLSFFYGSSKGSKDAGERMDTMVKTMSSKI